MNTTWPCMAGGAVGSIGSCIPGAGASTPCVRVHGPLPAIRAPARDQVSAGAPLNPVFSQVTSDGYEYDQDLLALNFDPRGEARVTVSRDG